MILSTSTGLSASSVSTMIAGAGPPSTCSPWPDVPACPLWSVGSLDSLGAGVRSSRSGAVGTSAVGSVMSPPYRGAQSSRNAAGPAPPRGSRPSGIRQVRSELVETESLVVQTDGLARARTEACVVVGVVARQRVHRGLGLLGGLDLDVPVAGQARAGRDELSEDDVLLEAEQRVGLGLHGGLREHAGRLLEGRGRQPRLGRQRGLGDPHELGTTGSRTATLGHDATVLVLEATTLGELAGQQVGVAGLDDRHATQHLAHDDLDVLVVDRHTLLAVHALDLVHQVLLRSARAEDAKDLLGVDRTLGQLGDDRGVVTVGGDKARALAHRVGVLHGAVVRREQDATRLVGVLDLDATGGLGDRGHTLGGARLEQLDDTRQTLGDVVGRSRTTGVEGTHRQLRAGLTDRLGRDDADGLADVDELARRERTAVAGGTGADLAVAGEDRTDPHLVDTGRVERVDDDVTEVDASDGEGLAVDDDVLGQRAGVDRGLDDLARRTRARGLVDLGDRQLEATLGATVVLTDDDVLRHVDETTRQVARVGGAERRVGQTLTGTVRRDEELEHREALTEV